MTLTWEKMVQAQTMAQLLALRPLAKDAEDFVNAAAEIILQREDFMADIRKQPELLIECLFFVVNKQKETVPFVLNAVQRQFVHTLNRVKNEYETGQRSDVSIMVLKGRQQGFTTLITAYQLAAALTQRNFEGLTIADDADNAQVIFENKAKFIYERLPAIFKPATKYNNRRELRFEKINSYLSVDVATKTTGRSRTVNFLHASECAYWRDGIAAVQAGLGEALTPNCIKIYESTANGFNDYQTMWQNGAHENLFFAWWQTPEYRLPVLENQTSAGDAWLAQRLQNLQEQGIGHEQCFWYAQKYRQYIQKELIRQEYPCSAEEAFLSSGRPVFRAESIHRRLNELSKLAYKNISFAVQYQNPKLRDTITGFSCMDGGFICEYEAPAAGIPYVIGGDTAGEGSDAYTAFVLRNDTGVQVASLHMPLKSADCTPFVEQLYALGQHYNQALLAPEINFNLQVVAELQRLQYPHLYLRRQEEKYTKQATKQFGFKTDGNTRPMILSLFSAVVAEHPEWILDRELLLECLTFEYDDKGRPDARAGTHDDRIFAAAIAHKAREQQSYRGLQEKKTVYVPRDIYEDYRRAEPEVKQEMEVRYGGILQMRSEHHAL